MKIRHSALAAATSIFLLGAFAVPLAACSSQQPSSNTANSATDASTDNRVASTDNASEKKEDSTNAAYADKLFDTSRVHTIDISVSDEDWADLKQNPTEKTKYHANVTIDGETLEDVSFATKGNTSLTSVAAMDDSDRYSFKVNFGKYKDDQTYYGLDKLNLNNIYADATYMKDYISYEMFQAAGVPAPLTSYVQLKVNGEDAGLYLAIEDVGESFVERLMDGEGELYKPETEMFDNIAKGPAQGGQGFQPGDMFNPGQGFGNFDAAGDNEDYPGKDGRGADVSGNEPDQEARPPEETGVQSPETQQGPGNTRMKPPKDGQAPGNMNGAPGEMMPEGAKAPENMESPESTELPEGMEGSVKFIYKTTIY